jgi:hypothetical protein
MPRQPTEQQLRRDKRDEKTLVDASWALRRLTDKRLYHGWGPPCTPCARCSTGQRWTSRMSILMCAAVCSGLPRQSDKTPASTPVRIRARGWSDPSKRTHFERTHLSAADVRVSAGKRQRDRVYTTERLRRRPIGSRRFTGFATTRTDSWPLRHALDRCPLGRAGS